jgi:hypothetical protein
MKKKRLKVKKKKKSCEIVRSLKIENVKNIDFFKKIVKRKENL